MTDDGLRTGALLVGGCAAGYAIARWLVAPRAVHASTSTSPMPAQPAMKPIDPYPLDEPVSSPAQVEDIARLPREFDPIFERYRGAIPIEYLRALSMRESGMNSDDRRGPAWGLMQVVEVVRRDYNKAHGTQYTREHLLDPAVSVAMCCWVLRTIISQYQKLSDVPNLRADWNNPRFVELVTYGWNAGFSSAKRGGGVGSVVRYLKARGQTDLTIDDVHGAAAAAGASRHLQNAAKVKWCKSVARLYERERTPGGVDVER